MLSPIEDDPTGWYLGDLDTELLFLSSYY